MKISESTLFDKPLQSLRPEKIGGVLWGLLAVLPLTAGIGYALLYSVGVVGLLSEGLTLSYWHETLTDAHVWFSLVYSFYVAVLSIVFSVVAALALTIVFRSRLDRGWTGLLLYAPLAIPSVVTAFFVYEMLTRSGWVSRLFRNLGLLQLPEQFPVLIQDPYAVGIVIAHVCMAAPFFLILFLNIYQNERIEEMRQVASTLGARWYQSDVKITVPLLINRSYPTIVLYFIFAMGSYEIPLLLGASSPRMLAVNVVRNLQQFSLDTIPAAYILSLLYVAFVLAILWMLLRRKKLFYDI